MSGDRPSHWLKPNHRQTYPSRVVWLDVETRAEPHPDGGERHVLTFGWALYRRRHRHGRWSAREWLRFDTRAALWDWLIAKSHARTRLYVFAHNAAYDMTVLGAWSDLPERDYRMVSAVYDSPPFLATFRRGLATILLWDTLNWWRVSLAKLGSRIGLAKLEMPAGWADRRMADRYCRRDVKIIEQSTLRWWSFLRTHDLGSSAPTLASQALTTFRHKHLTHRILCDGHAGSHEMARTAYAGGRTECWRLGRLRGSWALLDVRSMYPYVMREHRYPTILRSVYRRVTEGELRAWSRRDRVLVECELDTPEPVYALKVDGRLLFPTGRFRTVLTTPELRYALKRGHLRSWDRVAVYSADPIFRSFVDDIYALRLAARDRGDSAASYYLKILMNSLYGKFGQRLRRDMHLGPAENMDPRVWVELDVPTGETRTLRSFAGQLHELVVGGESWWAHPAIAAHVTAYARMHLWRLIRAAGRSHVAYMDTDSLLVDAIGANKLRGRWVGDALGALEVEGVYSDVTLHGPKDYVMDSKRRTKGVRPNATWIGPDTVEQEMWSGLRGLIQDGDVSAPRVRKVVKRLRRVYLKGRELPGGRVRPWRLPAELGAWRS